MLARLWGGTRLRRLWAGAGTAWRFLKLLDAAPGGDVKEATSLTGTGVCAAATAASVTVAETRTRPASADSWTDREEMRVRQGLLFSLEGAGPAAACAHGTP